jgi:hypothetical protein
MGFFLRLVDSLTRNQKKTRQASHAMSSTGWEKMPSDRMYLME